MTSGYSNPGVFRPVDVNITPSSWYSVGPSIRPFSVSTPASAAWGTADLAIYIPFIIPRGSRFLALSLFCMNGTVAAGTVDIGLYDDAWARVLSSGPTTQTGTSTVQEFAITDTWIGPGRYYLAMCCSDATSAHVTVGTGTAAGGALLGFAEQTSVASSTLPNPAVPVLFTRTQIPCSFGLAGRVSPL